MTNHDSPSCDVTHHILKFITLMQASYPAVEDLLENHDWHNGGNPVMEWLHFNWKLFIERELLKEDEILTSIGYAMIDKEKLQHRDRLYIITAKSPEQLFDLKNPSITVPFDKRLRLFGFTSFLRLTNEVSFQPPFDVAKLTTIRETGESVRYDHFYVPIEKLHFYLEKL